MLVGISNSRITVTLVTDLAVSHKVKPNLLHDPEILLRGIHPRDKKTHAHGRTCAKMFTAILFLIVPHRIQPKLPPIAEGKQTGMVTKYY